ncbi:hypothetical protein, partial [Yersinia intermedia]|uniref:hypothetical protein n=1 Tax=Yersinia intermedia TaxID=631 RepID=UPI002244D688
GRRTYQPATHVYIAMYAVVTEVPRVNGPQWLMNIGAQELSYASHATPDDFGRQRDCHFMGAYSPLSEW